MRSPWSLRGSRYERLLAQAEEIVLPHQPQHPLMVHKDAVAPQLSGYTPIAVAAFVRHDLLNQVAELRVSAAGRDRFEAPVVTCSADSCEPTQPLNGGCALHLRAPHHRVDDVVDVGAELSPFRTLSSCKARRKKSNSTACRPILRSSSAMR